MVSITCEDFDLRHFSGDRMEPCPRVPVQSSDLTMRQLSHGGGCKASPKSFSFRAPRVPSHRTTRFNKYLERREAGVAGQTNLQSGLLRGAGPIPQTGPGHIRSLGSHDGNRQRRDCRKISPSKRRHTLTGWLRAAGASSSARTPSFTSNSSG